MQKRDIVTDIQVIRLGCSTNKDGTSEENIPPTYESLHEKTALRVKKFSRRKCRATKMAAAARRRTRQIPVLPFFGRPFLTLSWFSTKKAFFTQRAVFSCNDSYSKYLSKMLKCSQSLMIACTDTCPAGRTDFSPARRTLVQGQLWQAI